jgi:Lrp/AsnC family leucine-responsive transcriptional regulator
MQNKIDKQDAAILRALQLNARITHQELAAQVGLSPSPCWTRVKRLEADGTIKGYVTILDQAQLGLPDTAIVEVTLERHEDDVFSRFEAFIKATPEIIEAHLMTGEFDYLLKLAVAGTAGYERFLREKLYKVQGIRHTRSSLTLRTVKQSYSPAP